MTCFRNLLSLEDRSALTQNRAIKVMAFKDVAGIPMIS